ncbi:MAG: transcription termination factor NusA [Proteiniphilum sp.]|nr:transcription termination factor NusA [Proteiniphilum sp.]
MGKKKETISLIDTFSEFNELKNIDKATLISVLEESFRNVISKSSGTDENYDIIINPDKGDLEIWRNRTIVEDDELEDSNLQITLSEALKIDEDFAVGEEVTDEVSLEHFGRRTILNLRQTLASKILELEKDNLYNKYKEKVGEIVSGEIYQIWKKELLLLDDEHNELILPKTEQIPSDFFRKGEHARAVVARVENKNNNPRIILSRTSPVFLERLFEQEIPEIADGLITIKGIARIPGERAKVAVEAYDDRIDPVGACVGMKGFRIHGIVRELRNENIDVINYTNNTTLFIQRALSPARINSITLKEEEHRAEVFLNPEEVSLAIGKGGANIKLASMLTGYNIEVFRDIDEVDEEDIYLDEFRDEIDGWVIDQLKKIGCSTAKNVLATSRERLIREADLEESTVDEVLAILRYEFEEEEEEGTYEAEADSDIPEEEDTYEAKAGSDISEEEDTYEAEAGSDIAEKGDTYEAEAGSDIAEKAEEEEKEG